MLPVVTTLPAGRFFGGTSLQLSVHGTQISVLTYAPSVVLPTHAHAQANFCFVLEGRYEETAGRATHRHAASHLIFHPAGQLHSDRHAPEAVRLLCVEFTPERAEQIRQHSKLFEQPGVVDAGPAVALCLRLYRELQHHDDISPLAVEGLTLEVLACASRAVVRTRDPAPPRWLGQAMELLRARAFATVSIEEVARETGIHPVHLARTFRRRFGCGPAEYIRRLRVESACRHLRDSSLALSEIALETGFSDQSHFTRAFRRLTGVTPAMFRRKNR